MGAGPLAPPSVHEFPAFPLDEMSSDDLEDDDDERSDPLELPFEHGLGSKVVDGIRGARRSLEPFANKAKQRLSPLAGRAKDRLSPIAGRARRNLSPMTGRTRN